VPVYLGRQTCDLENFQTINRAPIDQSVDKTGVIDFPMKRRSLDPSEG
jgi:hypothetical protein